MNYTLVPYSLEHFATDLQNVPRSNQLDWDMSPGQDVLLIQTPYGVKATDADASITGEDRPLLEVLCDRLSETELEKNAYTQVIPGVWVRYVSAADKVRMHGCTMHGEASTYSVIACDKKGEEVTVYTPRDQAMISPFCHIPMEVHVEIEKGVASVRKMFRTVEVETGFYIVTFPDDMAEGYQSGSLCLVVNGTEIPVTDEMLIQRTVFVKCLAKPELVTRNKGLKIV